MPLYHYRQNNSGGVFTEPAIHVFIEANSADEANDIAERNGLYFNGSSCGIDCECCGDRWYEQSRPINDVGKLLRLLNDNPFIASMYDTNKIPYIMIITSDGKKEVTYYEKFVRDYNEFVSRMGAE